MSGSVITVSRYCGSSVAMVAFTGNAQQLTMDPVRFMQRTGLMRHNVILVRDSLHRCYREGVSEEIRSLDELSVALGTVIADLPDVQEVLVLGTSSGGFPAIYCGRQLNAKAIWCLGGRICRIDLIREREDKLRKLLSTVLGESIPFPIRRFRYSDRQLDMLQDFSRSEHGREVLLGITEDLGAIIDESVLSGLVQSESRLTEPSLLHFYYARQNRIDSFVANSFRHLPHARLHPVDAPRDLDIYGAPKSHRVAQLLDEEDLLPTLFAPFL